MEIIVLQNQTIQDVATMYTGSSEHYLAILEANAMTDATLYVGQRLIIPDALWNKQRDHFYKEVDLYVACSPEALDPAEFVPSPPLPNSDVAVRINGTFITSVNAPQVADISLVDTNSDPVDVVAVGGVAQIPNVVIEQRNSLNEVQGTFEYTPGEIDHIVSPNATVVVKDFQGVPQSTTYVASGRTHDVLLPNPNVNVTVNGAFLQATQAPSNPNVVLKDSNGDPAEFTIEDGEVIVPASSGGGSTNYNLMKTGASSGVDAEIAMGYGDNLTTLDFPNYYGDFRRFTDRVGAQVYADDIVCDWSTWRENTGAVLMYKKTPVYVDDVFSVTVSAVRALTTGGFNDWQPANFKQLINIVDFGGSAYANRWVAPFSRPSQWGHTGSCTDVVDLHDFIYAFIYNVQYFIQRWDKNSTTHLQLVAVRMGNTTELP